MFLSPTAHGWLPAVSPQREICEEILNCCTRLSVSVRCVTALCALCSGLWMELVFDCCFRAENWIGLAGCESERAGLCLWRVCRSYGGGLCCVLFSFRNTIKEREPEQRTFLFRFWGSVLIVSFPILALSAHDTGGSSLRIILFVFFMIGIMSFKQIQPASHVVTVHGEPEQHIVGQNTCMKGQISF